MNLRKKNWMHDSTIAMVPYPFLFTYKILNKIPFTKLFYEANFGLNCIRAHFSQFLGKDMLIMHPIKTTIYEMLFKLSKGSKRKLRKNGGKICCNSVCLLQIKHRVAHKNFNLTIIFISRRVYKNWIVERR